MHDVGLQDLHYSAEKRSLGPKKHLTDPKDRSCEDTNPNSARSNVPNMQKIHIASSMVKTYFRALRQNFAVKDRETYVERLLNAPNSTHSYRGMQDTGGWALLGSPSKPKKEWSTVRRHRRQLQGPTTPRPGRVVLTSVRGEPSLPVEVLR